MAARAHTDAGRIAFAKHYIDQINETGKKPQTGILEPLSLSTCGTCRNFIDNVTTLKSANERFVGETYQVRKTFFPTRANHDLVEVFSYSPPGQRVDERGAILEKFPEMRQSALVFTLSWSESWKVAKIQIDTENKL